MIDNMRKHLQFLLAACLLASGAYSVHAQNRADRQNLENEDSFSMIILGDPQGYTKYDINQPIFELCTAWIADNVEHLNIKAVLCTGDMVEQNENITMNRKMLNQTSREMWESASRSMARLDGKVPYIISGGNHDYGYQKSENGRTKLPEYFPFERNSCWRDCLVADFPNRNGDISMENAAFEFHDKNWGDILVITTEFAPRPDVLDWARDLAGSEKFRGHKVGRQRRRRLAKNPGIHARRQDSEGEDIFPTLRNLSFHKTSRTPYRSLRPVRYADRFLTHLLETGRLNLRKLVMWRDGLTI